MFFSHYHIVRREHVLFTLSHSAKGTSSLNILKFFSYSLKAWVYALTAAIKSRNTRRSQVAKEILDIIAENKPILVEQATLVNDELIRCAILWHEQWHEALEEASRFYFQDKNVDEMMNILRPLHQKIEQGHTTMKEQSFNHVKFYIEKFA